MGKLEESLNGGYKGLYGEVVDRDEYHLRDLADVVSINDPKFIHDPGHPRGFNFIPDVVIDLGANVGVFSRYARGLFPKALIISVEPNPDNCDVFREHTNDERIILLQKAIGKGKVYHVAGAKNGAMHNYLSQSTGFSKSEIMAHGSTEIECILLGDLKKYIKEGDKVLLKVDVEGNETCLFEDSESMELMKTFGYIAMELHYFAATTEGAAKVRRLTDKCLIELSNTHNTKYIHPYFYGNKI